MSARAASRSRSRSADSSASGSWSSGRAPALQPAVAAAMSARPSCCTSRSRTAPSTRPSQPSSSRNTWARTGRTSANSASAARRRRVATRMSWSSSGSSPRRVPGSFSRTTASCRRRTAKASSPIVEDSVISVGPRSGDPGISWPMARRPASNFDRRAGWSPHEARSCSTIGSSASSHSARTSTSTRRSCVGRCPPPTTIMVSSSATSAASMPPTRRAKGRRRVRTWRTSRRRCAPTMARSRRPDGSVGPERGDAGRRQDLGHLEALAQAAALRRAGVLQRDLVVPAAPPGADDEPGAGDAPVVGVEVGVDQPPWRPGQRRDRPAVAGLDREGRQRGEPALDRSQVEGVELPFDLDGVGPAPLSFVPGIGHAGQATARPPPAPRAVADCRGSAGVRR